MDRKLFGIFSGTHITIMVGMALLAPGALVAGSAIPSYSNVAIENTNTGVRATVDAVGRVFVLDTIAAYANNPANYVNITDAEYSDGTAHTIYTVPSGKALIIKSWSVNYYGNNAGDDTYIYIASTIGGLDNIEGALTADAANHVYESGIIVPGGVVLSSTFGCSDNNKNAYQQTYIQGYLVPSGAVPSGADANAQIVHSGRTVQQGRRTL